MRREVHRKREMPLIIVGKERRRMMMQLMPPVTIVNDMWVGSSYVDHRVFGTTGFHGCIIAHCDVRPATAGVDNTITFACTNVSASAVEIVVRPYNPDLQLKWKTVADDSDVEVVPS